MNDFSHFRDWKSAAVADLGAVERVRFCTDLGFLYALAHDGDLNAYRALVEKFPVDVFEPQDLESYPFEVPPELVLWPVSGERDPDLACVWVPCDHCVANYLYPEA